MTRLRKPLIVMYKFDRHSRQQQATKYDHQQIKLGLFLFGSFNYKAVTVAKEYVAGNKGQWWLRGEGE